MRTWLAGVAVLSVATFATAAEKAVKLQDLPPAVQEPVIPEVLQPPADAPDRARTVAQDIGGLDPRQLPIDGPEDHFLHFHGTLHSAARVGHGRLPGGHSCHAAQVERSTHVSLSGGQLTYPQHTASAAT